MIPLTNSSGRVSIAKCVEEEREVMLLVETVTLRNSPSIRGSYCEGLRKYKGQSESADGGRVKSHDVAPKAAARTAVPHLMSVSILSL